MNATNTTPQRGSTILSTWRAQREAERGAIRNEVTYSASVMEAFGVTPGAAGIPVNATSAQRVSAVAACRQKIAGSISTLRLDVLQINGDQEIKLPRDALWYLLNESPHPQFTATSHWDNKVSEQLLRGDGYTWIRRKISGGISDLLPLPHNAVQPWRMPDGSIRYYVQMQEWGITTWLDPADVLHFPGSGFDGLRSMSVIAYGAKNAIGNALAMDEYSGRFFSNGAHPSYVLEAPAKMSPTAVEALQTAFTNKYSGLDNSHRLPLVLTEGITGKEISLSAEDAQLIEARKFQVVDIARAFGVPPHMIGETTGSSAVGAGYEQQARDFVMHTLRLHLKRLEQELNRKLFPRDTGKFVRFDLDDLIEGDSKSQAEYNRAALGGPGTGQGWLTVNEIRKRKGYAPIDGGDVLFDPRDQPAAAAAANVSNELRDLRATVSALADRPRGEGTVVNLTTPASVVNVENHIPEQPAPIVNNILPEQQAPIVNNILPEQQPPIVNNILPEQQPPVVNNILPEQQPPVVNVVNKTEPTDVRVISMPDRRTDGVVVRDKKSGDLTGSVLIERDDNT